MMYSLCSDKIIASETISVKNGESDTKEINIYIMSWDDRIG